MTKKHKETSYDLQCLMLVEYFYPDWSFEEQEGLAQMLQDLIEDYGNDHSWRLTRES